MANEPVLPDQTQQQATPPQPQGGGDQQLPAEVVQYVSNGMKVIHSPKTRDNIVKQLSVGNNPAAAVANTLFNVLKQLDGTSAQAGSPPSANTVLLASAPLMEQIIEIGEASKSFKISEDGIKEAAGRAVTLYIQDGMKSGKITMNNLQDLYGNYKNQAQAEQASKPVLPQGGQA
jgi:hypothetical protein